MEELRINLTGVLCMETLICNIYRITIKVKATVNIDPTAVKEVEDLGDDKGIGETEMNDGGMAEEGVMDRRMVRILNIPKRGIVGGEQEAGVSADGERQDVKEAGLEEIGGGDSAEVVGRDFKWEDGGEDGIGCEEFLVSGVF
jgi:hypothetical protein